MRIGQVFAASAVVLVATMPPLAQAQNFSRLGSGPFANAKPTPAPAQPPPPPALPGAASSRDAAPGSRAPTDMEPTEALFDAINRGDIGAVRDAISRGADLHGENALNMTPLELSIDLGRNDISFLLLSMREGGDSRNAAAPPSTTAAKPAPAKPAKQVARGRAAPAPAPEPTPSRAARLFAGDGGTPNPSAGFLGFDSSRR
jgi:hypothetical protein